MNASQETQRCAGQCGGTTVGRCTESAEVVFCYVISNGPQRVPLCGNCAGAWQAKFGGTDAGSSLSIEIIE